MPDEAEVVDEAVDRSVKVTEAPLTAFVGVVQGEEPDTPVVSMTATGS
jgi:hypothetical protein